MLAPKKSKYRKSHKGRSRGQLMSSRKTNVNFGSFGLKALGWSWMTSRQIEAVRRTISRSLTQGGKMWIRVFPDKPVTAKGEQTTLGGGKGSVDHYVCVIKPGMVMFEIDGVDESVAKKAFLMAGYKLGFKTRMIAKH